MTKVRAHLRKGRPVKAHWRLRIHDTKVYGQHGLHVVEFDPITEPEPGDIELKYYYVTPTVVELTDFGAWPTGRGLGAEALRVWLKDMARRGVAQVQISEVSGEDAERFYLREGFRIVEHEDTNTYEKDL